jgi:hypothetical protein
MLQQTESDSQAMYSLNHLDSLYSMLKEQYTAWD